MDAPRPLTSLGDMAAARRFWRSPEYQRYLGSNRCYFGVVAADGSFSFPNVAPGEYELSSQPRRNDLRHYAFGEHKRAVTVPAMHGETPIKPLDLGTIRYQPVLKTDQ